MLIKKKVIFGPKRLTNDKMKLDTVFKNCVQRALKVSNIHQQTKKVLSKRNSHTADMRTKLLIAMTKLTVRTVLR